MKDNLTKINNMKSSSLRSENLIKENLIIDYVKNLDEEKRLKFWIRTLLSSYSTFPEIIKTVDKIIELKASSISFASDIYNFTSTYNQVEQVIDLTERKNNLLNIHCICNKTS